MTNIISLSEARAERWEVVSKEEAKEAYNRVGELVPWNLLDGDPLSAPRGIVLGFTISCVMWIVFWGAVW